MGAFRGGVWVPGVQLDEVSGGTPPAGHTRRPMLPLDRPTAATILSLKFTANDKQFYSIATNGFMQKWRK